MIKFELTKEELDSIVGLMDAGVRASGLSAVRAEVVSVIEKIKQAIESGGSNNAT